MGFLSKLFKKKDKRPNQICCDKEAYLMKFLDFLISEYGFKFSKKELGNLVDENGKLWFYGPYNCYYFYNENTCINILNLVQRQDWNIYITKDVLSDQNQINKGTEISSKYCYDLKLFASVIKHEIETHNTIFGFKIH